MTKKLEVGDVKQLIQLRGLGHTQKEIGVLLGVSPAAVSYHLKSLRKRVELNSMKKVWNEYFATYYVSSKGNGDVMLTFYSKDGEEEKLWK